MVILNSRYLGYMAAAAVIGGASSGLGLYLGCRPSGSGGQTLPVDPPPPPRNDPPPPSLWAQCFDGAQIAPNSPRFRPLYGEGDDPGDTGGQGRELLGLGFPILARGAAESDFIRVDRFQVKTAKDKSGVMIANVDIGRLQLEPARDWDGTTFQGKFHCTNPNFHGEDPEITVRVAGSEQKHASDVYAKKDTTGMAWVYHLELQMEDGRWINGCEDPDDVAFPIPGYWSRTDYRYVPKPRTESREFSFACVRRDVAKCLRQGYSAYASDGRDKKILFEACTRMMRADYCGDGHSFTRDGSEVRLYDKGSKGAVLAKIKADQLDGKLRFEAKWDATKGAVCVAQPRYPELVRQGASAACLAKIQSRKCTQEEAEHDGDPVLFNYSCIKHPCGIEE